MLSVPRRNATPTNYNCHVQHLHSLRTTASTACKSQPLRCCTAVRGHSTAEQHSVVDSAAGTADEEALNALADLSGCSGAAACARNAAGVRGLVARKRVKKGNSAVRVPLTSSLTITDDPVESISIFGDTLLLQWQAVHGKLPDTLTAFITSSARWDVRLTAWLLWATKHGAPLWQRYGALLPSEDSMSILLNHRPQERHHLQLPSLIREATVQYEWAMDVHDTYMRSGSGELAALELAADMRDTLWSMSMVRSRTFADAVDGESLTLMVPFADLANHALQPPAAFRIADSRDEFEVYAHANIAAGSEITITYGDDKDNDELMRDYGFIMPANPNDRIAFDACSNADDSQHAASAASSSADNHAALLELTAPVLLEAFRINGSVQYRSKSDDGTDGDGKKSNKHAKASKGSGERKHRIGEGRLHVYGPDAPTELHTDPAVRRFRNVLLSIPVKPSPAAGTRSLWPPKPITEAGKAPAYMDVGFDIAAERQAVERMQDAVVQQLAALPTTLEYDEELLLQHACARSDSARMQPRVLAAVQCRAERKRLLQHALVVLDSYAHYLHLSTA